jgi:hypothetical protein
MLKTVNNKAYQPASLKDTDERTSGNFLKAEKKCF